MWSSSNQSSSFCSCVLPINDQISRNLSCSRLSVTYGLVLVSGSWFYLNWCSGVTFSWRGSSWRWQNWTRTEPELNQRSLKRSDDTFIILATSPSHKVNIRHKNDTQMSFKRQRWLICPHLFHYFIDLTSNTSFIYQYNSLICTTIKQNYISQ